MNILGYPLGLIMRFFYNILHSYGWALILFTVIIKVAMIPLGIKQQKMSAKMAAFQPEMQEIQKKYAKNQQKMAEEMQKLYERENYSPTSGCLPTIIQFLILFGLIDVIYNPLRHILGVSKDVIAQALEILQGLGHTLSTYSPQSSIITSVQSNPDAYMTLGQDFVEKIQSFDLSFLGINLGATPTLGFNILILIPILSGITSFMMSFVSMRANPVATQGSAGASMKVMMYTMPLMSLWIAFKVPAGVGIYWVVANVISIAQTMVLNKFYNPREMAEKAKAELEARRERERLERIEAKKLVKQGVDLAKDKAKSQKEINRQKLAEARKREAEKYGETYVDVTDEDLD